MSAEGDFPGIFSEESPLLLYLDPATAFCRTRPLGWNSGLLRQVEVTSCGTREPAEAWQALAGEAGSQVREGHLEEHRVPQGGLHGLRHPGGRQAGQPWAVAGVSAGSGSAGGARAAS